MNFLLNWNKLGGPGKSLVGKTIRNGLLVEYSS